MYAGYKHHSNENLYKLLREYSNPDGPICYSFIILRLAVSCTIVYSFTDIVIQQTRDDRFYFSVLFLKFSID